MKLEGNFFLRYRTFDLFGSSPASHTECCGDVFRVYSTKEFPGLNPSTDLTKVWLFMRWFVLDCVFEIVYTVHFLRNLLYVACGLTFVRMSVNVVAGKIYLSHNDFRGGFVYFVFVLLAMPALAFARWVC